LSSQIAVQHGFPHAKAQKAQRKEIKFRGSDELTIFSELWENARMFAGLNNRSSGRPPALTEILASGSRILASTIRLCVFAPSREKSVFIGVHPWLKKHEIAKRTQFPMQASINQKDMRNSNLPIKVNQGYSNLVKAGTLPGGYCAKRRQPSGSAGLRLLTPIFRKKRLFIFMTHTLPPISVGPCVSDSARLIPHVPATVVRLCQPMSSTPPPTPCLVRSCPSASPRCATRGLRFKTGRKPTDSSLCKVKKLRFFHAI
jgi:hypothetical protein